MTRHVRPAADLSVVFAVRGTFANNRKTLECLCAQTIAPSIELIVVSNDAELLRKVEDFVSSSGCFSRCTFLFRAGGDMARDRMLATAEATAAAVAFAEDHAFPERNWAEELATAFALSKNTLAAAPLILNLNPESAVSRAQFLVTHGWHQGGHSSERFEDCADLPWHSTAYRRDVFAAETSEGGVEIFQAESFLQERIRRSHPDARLVQCTHTSTHHGNMSRLYPALIFAFHGGRLFGALRCRQRGWGLGSRIARSCLFPVVAVLSVCRTTPILWDRCSWPRTISNVLLTFPIAFFHAMGEAIGTCCGVGESERAYATYEYNRARLIRAADRSLFLSSDEAPPIACHHEATVAGKTS